MKQCCSLGLSTRLWRSYSQIRCIGMRVLQTGFSVPSIILEDLSGNKCLLVFGAFRSTLFVSVFQGSLLVIALFRAIVDQFSSNIFPIYLILVSWKNKALSASCPLQKYHSSSRFPSLFLSSLESFSVLFLRAKLGESVALWLTLTPIQRIWP